MGIPIASKTPILASVDSRLLLKRKLQSAGIDTLETPHFVAIKKLLDPVNDTISPSISAKPIAKKIIPTKIAVAFAK